MAAASTYLEDEILDHIFGEGVRDFRSPPTLFLSLHTETPTDAMNVGEVSGNGYARKALVFGAASAGVVSNTAQVTFTASGGNWGTITHIGIFDAATAGNGIFHGALTSSRTVNDGDDLVFAIGDIDCSLV